MDSSADHSDRFSRISMAIGGAALETLSRSHVTIVGLGAVGSFALEALARTAIGSLRIVDFDVLRPSNTNRQILASSSTFGRKKIDVAMERVLSINPLCNVEQFECFFDPEHFKKVFEKPTDIVIDAIDSLNPKIALLTLLHEHGIPVISSMGAARKTDPSLVTVADIADVEICPLGVRVRKHLRNQGIAKGIRCVFSREMALDVAAKHETREEESFKRGRARVPFGSLVFVPAAFGIRAAYEAWKFIMNGKKFGKIKRSPPAAGSKKNNPFQ